MIHLQGTVPGTANLEGRSVVILWSKNLLHILIQRFVQASSVIQGKTFTVFQPQITASKRP